MAYLVGCQTCDPSVGPGPLIQDAKKGTPCSDFPKGSPRLWVVQGLGV